MVVDQETLFPGARPHSGSARRELRSPVSSLLERVHEAHLGERGGDVAAYIPELASVDPDAFGIAIATTDGSLYEVGDSRTPFTLQSVSKPLTYGHVLERFGTAAVHTRIGVEPSGDAFNSIALAPETGTAANAMINAGAITAAALVAAAGDDPFVELLDVYGRYAGRRLEMDQAVYRSERLTGHRNRAIAHLLRTFEVIGCEPEAAVDLYFRQCAVTADCRDLAVIGATLANGGLNPRTGERAVGAAVVRDVLSVMTTCGMYDGAGRWLTQIGLPAKSGVAGGIVAVLPGRLAIAVYSPRLDAQGNSVRGMAVCGDLSDRLGLHLVRPGERVASPIRSSRTLREAASRRARSVEQRRALEEVGQSAVVVELQGELGFAAVELLARRMETSYTAPSVVILDLRRVTAGDPGAVALLEELRDSARAAGTTFAVAGIPSPEVTELLGGFDGFADLDGALEWCEDVLLREAGVGEAPPEVDPAEHELLCGLPGATLALISMMLRPRRHAAGELVVRTGDPSDELFLVVAGELTVVDAAAGERRLATVSAGGTFGELGFVLDVARTADVRADTDVRLLVLDRATVAELRDHHPAVHAALLERLLASLARTTVRLDREARAGAR